MLFAKLFRSQYDSSIANNYLVRWVFNDLIILSDMEGFVDMTYESIARVTGVPLDIIKHSIASLMADDPMSRCKEYGGKRLVPMLDEDGNPRPGGWKIVNKPYYMKVKDAETMRERNRLRQARHRVTKKRDKSVTVTLSNAASHHVTPNKNENKKEIKSNTPLTAPAAPRGGWAVDTFIRLHESICGFTPEVQTAGAVCCNKVFRSAVAKNPDEESARTAYTDYVTWYLKQSGFWGDKGHPATGLMNETVVNQYRAGN